MQQQQQQQQQQRPGSAQSPGNNITDDFLCVESISLRTTVTESNDEKMMKTSKVAKHEMATKIIFSQALGVCAELRT